MKIFLFLFIPFLIFAQEPTQIDNKLCVLDWELGTTVSGAGVSEWLDQTSNNLDFIQGTDADRPNLGVSSIEFDKSNSEWLDDLDNDLWSFTDGAGADEPFSIVAYVKIIDDTLAPILTKFNTNPNSEWRMELDGSGKFHLLLHGGGDGAVYIGLEKDAAMTSYENQWITLACTYDGSEGNASAFALYVDGVEATDTTFVSAGSYAGMSNGTSPTRLNTRVSAPQYSDIEMTDLIVTTDVLTPTEIAQLDIYFRQGSFPADYDTTNYYVDNSATGNGSDDNTGFSVVDPLVSFDSLNTAGITLEPGDVVHQRTGTEIDQTLTVPSSGTSGNPITFTVYDSTTGLTGAAALALGDTAVISGADLINTWVVVGGGVYYNLGMSTEPKLVIFDGVKGTHVANVAAVNSQDEWFWTTSGDDSLFIFTSTAADTNNMEAGQRDLCISIDTKDYITIDGLTLKYANAHAVKVEGGSDNFVFQNSVAEYNWNQGLYIKEAGTAQDDGLIDNNIVRYNGSSGITLEEIADGWTISNNTLNNNGTESSFTWTSGVKLWCDDTTTITNNIVENNTVYINGEGMGNNGGKGMGIWMDLVKPIEGNENIIRYNEVYGNNSNGIYLEKSSNTDVYYNILYDNGEQVNVSAGIMLMASDGSDCDSNHVYNNTIYNENKRGISAGTQSIGTAKDNIFRNNIVDGSSGFELLANNGFTNADADSGSGNIYDSNCFGVEYTNFIMWNGNRSTYDAFIAASSQIDNNVESDPLFTNAASNDFTLQSGSPAIDAGVDVGLVLDYAGNAVPAQVNRRLVDIGAYEYLLNFGYENRHDKHSDHWRYKRY